jgi:TatD DNase family protein
MFVDIHTHNSVDSKYTAIRNLTFSEANNIFSSNKKGIFSIGFHPWFADEYSDDSFNLLVKWANDKRFVFIGECGLDKNSKVSLDKQLRVFEKQIALSEKILKPLIIHCVGCFNELFELKKKLNPRQLWIIHGFRGKPELAKQVLKSGISLSFGEHFNIESVRITPLDNLYIETDESRLTIYDLYHAISIIKNCEEDKLNAGETLIKSFPFYSK